MSLEPGLPDTPPIPFQELFPRALVDEIARLWADPSKENVALLCGTSRVDLGLLLAEVARDGVAGYDQTIAVRCDLEGFEPGSPTLAEYLRFQSEKGRACLRNRLRSELIDRFAPRRSSSSDVVDAAFCMGLMRGNEKCAESDHFPPMMTEYISCFPDVLFVLHIELGHMNVVMIEDLARMRNHHSNLRVVATADSADAVLGSELFDDRAVARFSLANFLEADLAAFLGRVLPESAEAPQIAHREFKRSQGYYSQAISNFAILLRSHTEDGIALPPAPSKLIRTAGKRAGVAKDVLDDFLLLAGLCGPVVPVDFLFDFLGASTRHRDLVIEAIDSTLVALAPEDGLVDHHYHHPGFPGTATYGLVGDGLKRSFVAGKPAKERTEQARNLYRHLEGSGGYPTRAWELLLYHVGRHFDANHRREESAFRLAWRLPLQDQDRVSEVASGRLCSAERRARFASQLGSIGNRWPSAERIGLLRALEGVLKPDAAIELATARALFDEGRCEEALSCALAAETKSAENSVVQVWSKLTTGLILRDMDKLVEARTKIEEARCLAQSLPDFNPLHTSVITSGLASVRAKQGDYGEARDMLIQVLRLQDLVLPNDDPRRLDVLNNLASVAEESGDFASAKHYYESALKSLSSCTQAAREATLCEHLGQICMRTGDKEAALNHYQRALAAERRSGRPHGETLLHLGQLSRELGSSHASREYYQGALRKIDKQTPAHLNLILGLAEVCRQLGDLASSREYYEDALSILRQTPGDSQLELKRSTLKNLAQISEQMSDTVSFRTYLSDALDLETSFEPCDLLQVSVLSKTFAQLCWDCGDLPEAVDRFRRGLHIDRAREGECSSEVATTLKKLAAIYRQLKDWKQARECLAEALSIDSLPPCDWSQVVATRNSLGAVLCELGEWPAAEAHFEGALQITVDNGGAESTEAAVLLAELGKVRLRQGDSKAAEECFARALPIARRRLGDSHRFTMNMARRVEAP